MAAKERGLEGGRVGGGGRPSRGRLVRSPVLTAASHTQKRSSDTTHAGAPPPGEPARRTIY